VSFQYCIRSFFLPMDQDRISILLAKYVAGEANAEELEELEWAFLANPEFRRMAALLEGLRQAPPKGVSAEEELQMLESGLKKIINEKEKALVDKEKVSGDREKAPVMYANPAPGPGDAATAKVLRRISVRRIRVIRWMAAASVLLLLGGGFLYFHAARNTGVPGVSSHIVAAARGDRRYMRLSDGTQLWLNAGSRIVFADGFSGSKRELVLEGEAFFDVKHDEQHPFIIHTGRLEVKVLGTSVNVKAYPGDSAVEATLINGKVEIGIAGDPQSSIVLHPNEKVVIPNNPAGAIPMRKSPIVPDQTDGTITETSWVENKLVFRNETLAGMTTRLERWYNVTIVFDSGRYQQDTISGTFPNVPIGDVMHALQITAGFHYRIAKDTVRIW
jgi:transmembrane sensor